MTSRTAAEKLAKLCERLKFDPRSTIAWQLSIALKEFADACLEEDRAAARTEEARVKACAVLEKAKTDFLAVAGKKGGGA